MFFYILEKLTGQKLDVPEVTQSEENQKQKLQTVLGYANRVSCLKKIKIVFHNSSIDVFKW